MTREEAIEKFLTANPQAQRTVSKLMLWDSQKTIIENSETCGVEGTHQNRYLFAKRYGLGYARQRITKIKV